MCIISLDVIMYTSKFVFTVKKPTSVSYVEAAGCIGDAVKAYTALHYLGRMCSGETGRQRQRFKQESAVIA